MSEDGVDVTAEDALQVAQRALTKANRVDGLEERVDELENDLAGMALRLSAIEEDRPYDGLTLNEKIGMVREELFNQATDGRGRTMEYSDVRDIVFDGMPSGKHCYKLMRLAADAQGFRFRDPENGNKRLVVDPEEAKRTWAFCSENKAQSMGGRSG